MFERDSNRVTETCDSSRGNDSSHAITGVTREWCWRPLVTGVQVIVFVAPAQKFESISMVYRGCWIPTRVRPVTTPLYSLYELNRQ